MRTSRDPLPSSCNYLRFMVIENNVIDKILIDLMLAMYV